MCKEVQSGSSWLAFVGPEVEHGTDARAYV